MSQHDMNIANQGFPAFRADLNAALEALVSSNSGATAPATTFANMPWYDTANNIFKIRNEDNDAWISVFTLDQSTDAITAIGSVTLADVVSLTGTQILTNKTLTSPAINGQTVDKITDTQGGVFTPSSAIMRNRIINGAMVIDQRNAGAAITASGFPVDRFGSAFSTDGAFSAQQDSSAPAGFTNSVKCTTTTADASLSASQYWFFRQRIEGYNVADLGFGTAAAKTITLSFWVRSSLTGTFSGSVLNGDTNRSYPFNYTISAADTWEQKSVTIAGDTSGTWNKTNGNGMVVAWSLGIGSNFQGTANAWGAAEAYGTAGSVSVIGTLSATWYVTGVQLEVGTQATSFEYRQYTTELQLCQRYAVMVTGTESDGGYCRFFSGQNYSTTLSEGCVFLPVKMRTYPSLTASATAGNYSVYAAGSGTACSSSPVLQGQGQTPQIASVRSTVASGLTTGQAMSLTANATTSAYLLYTAEL